MSNGISVKLPRDRLKYSPIVNRDKLTLPGKARVAVWTIVNVEEWDIHGPMPRTVLPPPGGVTLVPDLPNWAWHEYGMRVGFWRLKSALDKYGIKATLAINGSVCLSYPFLAEAAMKAGWEFIGHGFTQKALPLVEDQREVIVRTIKTIRDFTGTQPRGWLGPGLTEKYDTVDILAEEGIEYVCDWVVDDQPVPLKTSSGSLVALPYTVELNDISVIVLQRHTARDFYLRACDQFDRLYQEGRKNPRIMAVAVHPYISGVPHRIKYFEKIYSYIRKKKGVLFWNGEQILDWYKTAQALQGDNKP